MRKVSILAMAAVLSALSAMPAGAAPSSEPNFVFKFDARDLDSEMSTLRLFRELRREANSYCRSKMAGRKGAISGCRRFIVREVEKKLQNY